MAALNHLAMVVVTLIVLALIPYASPSLERLRAWVPGDGWPLLSLFRRVDAGPPVLPEFAEAAQAIGSGPTRTAPHGIGEALAAHLQAPASPLPSPAASPTPTPARNESSAAARHPAATAEPATAAAPPAGHATAASPQPTGRRRSSPSPLQIDAKQYAGVSQLIEELGSHPLDSFYQALANTALAKPGAITRVAHYGDSAVAADGITYTMRRNLQLRFGDAGHGFMLISRGYMHYMHRGIRYGSSGEWDLYPIVRQRLGKGWYGYGGVQYRGTPGVHAYFGSVDDGPIGRQVSRFEILYQRHPRGGLIKYQLDDQPVRLINTRGERGDAHKRLQVPDGSHLLRLRVSGRGHVRLYGVVLEREGPGVVYDSLGLVGARARRLLNFDPQHMANQLRHRDPDLVILAFGGNEATDPLYDWDLYKDELRRVIRIMRADRPRACLLFAPLDQGHKNKRGQVVTVPNLPRMVKAQREVAKAEGCAFFDTFSAMGGPRSMWRWYRSRPRLALSDFRHATPAGYELIGNVFYKAVLKGFSDYLARAGR